MCSEGYEKTKEYYLDAMSQILKGLLHWDEGRIRAHVNGYRELLNDPKMSIILNRAPLRMVVAEAIPPRLKEKMAGLPLVRLAETLEDEVSKGGDCWGPGGDFDWEGARARVNNILREYGEALPD